MSSADLFALALAQSLAQSNKHRGHSVHMQRGQGPENKKKVTQGNTEDTKLLLQWPEPPEVQLYLQKRRIKQFLQENQFPCTGV